jgi:Tfp pilus assembly protein PilO
MKFGVRELVFVAAMVGLLAASYLMVFKKATERRQKIEADIVTKQKALADLDRATAGISDVNAKIEELQKAIAFFEGKLPQEKEIDKVLREVWQMAESKQLTIKTIKTLRSERNSNYSEQPIEMSLSGDFKESFYAFMLQLEQLPRLTRVSKMDLKKINNRDGQMEAQVTLSIFFEPETGGTTTASTN